MITVGLQKNYIHERLRHEVLCTSICIKDYDVTLLGWRCKRNLPYTEHDKQQ